MSNNQWLLKTFVTKEDREKAEELNLNPEVVALLGLRGFKDPKDILEFVHPQGDLPDPFSFKQMKNAVGILSELLIKQGRVTIYGDYDADGISATALMFKALQTFGFKHVEYFIPSRFEQGYGLNTEAIKEISEKGCDLIITVDCGITSLEEAKLIDQLGMKLIITDHHIPLSELPQAAAIINPHVPEETYPFLHLAGVGVAFELMRGFAISIGKEEVVKELLPYVALGTIGDVMPLISVNRILVKMGLERINENSHAGIRLLMEKAGIKRISSASQVAFQIVPKINASGRMATAEVAVKTLLALPEEAEIYVDQLEFLNKERKEREQEVYNEAIGLLEREDLTQGGFVFTGLNWHQGVLGIVAAKLSELVEKPVFVLTEDNGQIKGSGRAPEGFDLHSILQALEHHLMRYGGHAQAAGITLDKESLEIFSKEFSYFCSLYQMEQEIFREIDLDIDIETDLNVLHENLKALEPMGQNNEEPLFLLRSAEIIQTRAISEGAHLQIHFQFGQRRYQAFAWRQGHYLQDFSGLLDLVIKVQTNVYRGIESMRVEIVDWRPAALLDSSQLAEIRKIDSNSTFYFHSPESLNILYESGLAFDQRFKLSISSEFPFLPCGQFWPSSNHREIYLLDYPMAKGIEGKKIYNGTHGLNFKLMLNWLLPDREHLAQWYRWLKGEGLVLNGKNTNPYPGGLDDFYAEIALSNVLNLFLQAGLIELREKDFFWLEPKGKIDLHSLDEFKIMERRREELKELLN